MTSNREVARSSPSVAMLTVFCLAEAKVCTRPGGNGHNDSRFTRLSVYQEMVRPGACCNAHRAVPSASGMYKALKNNNWQTREYSPNVFPVHSRCLSLARYTSQHICHLDVMRIASAHSYEVAFWLLWNIASSYYMWEVWSSIFSKLSRSIKTLWCRVTRNYVFISGCLVGMCNSTHTYGFSFFRWITSDWYLQFDPFFSSTYLFYTELLILEKWCHKHHLECREWQHLPEDFLFILSSTSVL